MKNKKNYLQRTVFTFLSFSLYYEINGNKNHAAIKLFNKSNIALITNNFFKTIMHADWNFFIMPAEENFDKRLGVSLKQIP